MVYGGVEGGANKATVIWLGTNPAASSPQPGDTHALWLRNATSVFGDPVSPVQATPTKWARRSWTSPSIPPTGGASSCWTPPAESGSRPTPARPRLSPRTGPRAPTGSGASSRPTSAACLALSCCSRSSPKVNGNDVVLVGGQGGVFRRIADGPWHEYGVGLPNALTTVLERVGGTDDLLLQGTFGRGAWTLDLASQTLGTPTELTIKGTSGDDEIVLRRNALQPWLLDVFLFADGQAEPDLASYSVPFANLTKITIDVSGAGSGNDDILIDGDFGSVVTSNGTVQVIGGGGSDSLTVTPSLDPEDVLFAGTLNGNAANGSIMHGFSDEFGDFDLEEVTWTGLASVNGSVVAQPSVEGVADGLKAVADALLPIWASRCRASRSRASMPNRSRAPSTASSSSACGRRSRHSSPRARCRAATSSRSTTAAPCCCACWRPAASTSACSRVDPSLTQLSWKRRSRRSTAR